MNGEPGSTLVLFCVLLTWLTHRKEMGSEGFWLVNQSINHLEIAKF